MILHVATLDKFIPAFIELVEDNFDKSQNFFWLKGDVGKYPVGSGGNILVRGDGIWSKLRSFVRLLVLIHSSNKVVLHSLSSPKIVTILFFFPWVLPKCYWFIWGDDLYQYRNKATSVKARRNERRRKFVIKRLGGLVTYIEGDVKLAREWYGAGGKYYECLLYPSNVFELPPSTNTTPECGSGGVNILLGNSASASNNHLEVMQRMIPYKDYSFMLYVPLSYGSKEHARLVIQRGHELFGEKFKPVTNFMPYGEYVDFLLGMDVAIFNHSRQQAMGNTILLLGMGKTVYMRTDVPQWSFLTGLGLRLRDVEDFSFSEIDAKDKERNSEIVRNYFSRNNLVGQLKKVLEG